MIVFLLQLCLASAVPSGGDPATLTLSGLQSSYTLRDPIRFVVTNASSTPQTFHCEAEIYLQSLGGKWQEWGYRVEDNAPNQQKIMHQLGPKESQEFVWKPRMGWSSAPATLRFKLVRQAGDPQVTYSPEFILHRRRTQPRR